MHPVTTFTATFFYILHNRSVIALSTTEPSAKPSNAHTVDIKTILIIVLASVIAIMCILICIKEKQRSRHESMQTVPKAHKSASHSASDEVDTLEVNRLQVNRLESQPTSWTQNSLSSKQPANKTSPITGAALNKHKHGTIPPGTGFQLNISEIVAKQPSHAQSLGLPNKVNNAPVDRGRHIGESSDAISEVLKNDILINIGGGHRKKLTNLGAEGIMGKMVNAASKSNLTHMDSDRSNNLSVLQQVGFSQVADAASSSNLSVAQTKGKSRHDADASSISNLDDIQKTDNGNNLDTKGKRYNKGSNMRMLRYIGDASSHKNVHAMHTKGNHQNMNANQMRQIGDASSRQNLMETKKGSHKHNTQRNYDRTPNAKTGTFMRTKARTDTMMTNVTLDIDMNEDENSTNSFTINSDESHQRPTDSNGNNDRNIYQNSMAMMVNMQTGGNYSGNYTQSRNDVLLSMARTKTKK